MPLNEINYVCPSSHAEAWYRFELNSKQRIRFVLDASDIGLKHQTKIAQLLLELCDQLPGLSNHTVTFLGSSEIYEASRSKTDTAAWFARNKLRASVIHEVYESAEPDISFVVIAASPIFDLMDWKDSPQIDRTAFYNVGEQSLTAGLSTEITAGRHASHAPLGSPKSITIQAGQALPVYWDNQGYSLDHHYKLQCLKQETFSVTFALLGSAPRVQAFCTYETGKQELLTVRRIERPHQIAAWSTMSQANEAEIAHACIRVGEFTCPYCKKQHTKSQLTCRLQGQFLPTSVFPSIKASFQPKFALLRQNTDGTISFIAVRNPTLALNSTDVVVFHSEQPKILQYDAELEKWRVTDRNFAQFSFLKLLEAYAICLR